MRDFLERYRSTIVIFMAIVVPLFLIYIHGRSPGKSTILTHALLRVTSPAQAAADKLVAGVRGLWDNYIALVDVKDENDDLRRQVRGLEANAFEAKRLFEENQALRRQLQFKRARKELKLVAAHVIGKDISPYARVVRISIDVGAEDAVREGMPVVTEQGLVGRIRQVSGRYAEVLLTVDKDSRVNVKVAGRGVTGTIRGTGVGNEYSANLLYLQKASALEVNDTLVTSGHDKVFPPNIEVGYIKSLEERQRGIYYELQVRPAVNFSVLEVVQVVVGVVDEMVSEPPKKKKKAKAKRIKRRSKRPSVRTSKPVVKPKPAPKPAGGAP